jgi:hypothetical protein
MPPFLTGGSSFLAHPSHTGRGSYDEQQGVAADPVDTAFQDEQTVNGVAPPDYALQMGQQYCASAWSLVTHWHGGPQEPTTSSSEDDLYPWGLPWTERAT